MQTSSFRRGVLGRQMLFVKIGGICQNFGSAKHKQVLCRGVGWGVGMQMVEEDDENIFKNLNFEIILLLLTFSLDYFFSNLILFP